jgi:hypothetical protein
MQTRPIRQPSADWMHGARPTFLNFPRSIEVDALLAHKPAVLTVDKAAMAARRLLQARIDAEMVFRTDLAEFFWIVEFASGSGPPVGYDPVESSGDAVS